MGKQRPLGIDGARSSGAEGGKDRDLRCFVYIEDWVEKKIRRHMMRARERKGLGWKRWSGEWLYQILALFNDYRVRYYQSSPKVALAG
jgi:hypothetical protein